MSLEEWLRQHLDLPQLSGMLAYQQDCRRSSLFVHFVAPKMAVVEGMMIHSFHLDIRMSSDVVFASGAAETRERRFQQVIELVFESKAGMM